VDCNSDEEITWYQEEVYAVWWRKGRRTCSADVDSSAARKANGDGNGCASEACCCTVCACREEGDASCVGCTESTTSQCEDDESASGVWQRDYRGRQDKVGDDGVQRGG
jgi:hypothetical protein